MINVNILDRLETSKVEVIKELETWIIKTTDFNDQIPLLSQYLSIKDTIEKEKIIKENFKKKFIVRKSLLRIILSDKLGISPQEVEFSLNDYGKPFLNYSNTEKIYFNISHSLDYFLIGVSKKSDLGVDIECIRTLSNVTSLSEFVFSDEEKYILNSIAPQLYEDFFYKIWVQKESISKAIGMGMNIDFKKISVYKNINETEKVINNIIVNNNNLDVFLQHNNHYYLSICMLNKNL